MTYLGAPTTPDDSTLAIEPFLEHELARIRCLAENTPDVNGNYTELFWSLVVGLSRTKNLPLVHSIGLVNDFLLRKAPELPIPATVDAGTERMQRVQKQTAAYKIDRAFQYDPSLASSATLRKARRGMAVMAVVSIGLLLMDHDTAVREGKVSPVILFVCPMAACISLAGVFDPRIVWALSNNGQNMPARYKWMGGIAAMIGLSISLFLAYMYHLGG